MQLKKPYFYFAHNDHKDSFGNTAINLSLLTSKMQYLFKINLNEAKEIRRYTPVLQIVLNTIDYIRRIRKLEDFIIRLEVALDIVNKAFNHDKQSICEMYRKVGNELSIYEEEVHSSRTNYNDAMMGEETTIQKFKSMFQYYLDLYKEYYSIVSTFPYYSLDVIENKALDNQDTYLQKESKIKIERFSSPLVLNRYPLNCLTEGCNRHIRNALSHENRHKFIDDKKTNLIDINLKGKIVFNQSYTLDEFEKILLDLVTTVYAIRTALIIFNINEGQTISKLLGDPKLTIKELEKVAFLAAKDSMLDYEGYSKLDEENAFFVVSIQKRYKADYYVGVGSYSKKVDIKDIPPAVNQIARFLQIIYIQSGKIYKNMGATLLGLDKSEIGRIEVASDCFLSKNADDFLKKAKINTIPKDFALEI